MKGKPEGPLNHLGLWQQEAMARLKAKEAGQGRVAAGSRESHVGAWERPTQGGVAQQRNGATSTWSQQEEARE